MAAKLGYGGVANTNGARDFSGKVEAVADDAYRSRTNNFNRRRYSGLWGHMIILSLMEAILGGLGNY